jgi:hypothetical protein
MQVLLAGGRFVTLEKGLNWRMLETARNHNLSCTALVTCAGAAGWWAACEPGEGLELVNAYTCSTGTCF